MIWILFACFIFYFDEARQKSDILRMIFVIFPQKHTTIGTIWQFFFISQKIAILGTISGILFFCKTLTSGGSRTLPPPQVWQMSKFFFEVFPNKVWIFKKSHFLFSFLVTCLNLLPKMTIISQKQQFGQRSRF